MTTDEICEVLNRAHEDIGHWCQLAERQRAETPDCDYAAMCPSADGIKASREVQAKIGRAIAELRKTESVEVC